VQVDPIKSVLKPHGSMLLKLIYYEPLSTFAVKFNLRRYTKAFASTLVLHGDVAVVGRGLHSSISQLNLSRFCHFSNPLNTPKSLNTA